MLEQHSSTAAESDFVDVAELQLQQELRSMFAVDTQTYLQTYMNLVQKLQPQTWTADIQETYRCVHTIKGGAVTVGADGILYVSTILEDLLFDLRYLQTAPPLEDGQLSQMLAEAGELLTASLQVEVTGEAAIAAVQPSVDRIAALRQEIQQLYLPEANEQTKLFQEFAEQGFDLVVLDLEMALEEMPDRGQVPPEVIKIAKQTLQQLIQIGNDLEFEAGWLDLLRYSKALLNRPESDFWRSQWSKYLPLLKDSARQGGKLPAGKGAILATSHQPPATLPTPVRAGLETRPYQLPTPAETNIQVPVPLERLERSSQRLVETLLSARAVQGFYQSLQTQIGQLLSLAQDSVQYLTQLRQVQDDYALLDNLQQQRSSLSTAPVLERYRQGYTIVNRLLEVSLRLSELGAEAATSSRLTADSLQLLDRNVLNLQQTVEESRLIPFKVLGFRAKGILRDLINRFGKPAQLIVQGEHLELDAGTVQHLEPALLHLMRNAYDHALEPAADRLALGKSEQGTIILSLRRQGKFYLLSLQDDGGGIDASKISQLAQARGLPLTRTDTPADLLAVLCQPGFSSRSEVSDISGRGVGMDVVATQIASIGGHLNLKTLLGAGTTFQMQVPVPHLLVRCVLVQAGDRNFAIPAEEIVTTTLWSNLSATPSDRDPMSSAPNWFVTQDEASMPCLDLLEYWQPGARANRPLSDTAICLRIRPTFSSVTAERDAWLLADDLLEQSELLIEPLPSPLISPLGLMGVTLQTDGMSIAVLEPASLAAHLWMSPIGDGDRTVVPSFDLAEIFAEPPAASRTILVVDDAALVRRRIEASLTANGYTVETCRDGLEAWTWLSSHPVPALLITDIEMPGMDGFTLIDRCRQAGMKLPALVISSRLSEEWSNEARRVGATDYLTKGFTTPELLSKVGSFVSRKS
ncbi:MAG: Sensor histidine kinase RcsC [Chroococcidiopsis sp. SAG 2025]|uniref:hybrid sensor histidine kinase/response regulator n=1 Tax=Chroococcidiopsis sp. SAG 2025 TaxID=171389 RepID=UPI002936E8F9|nr:response regulator [Chroococcidiopsis sp. SAG 2025]MDV2993718.1 Sensor histidine kinase RcsC [Chroococcidiopsis sp. SAG 2025]